MIRRASKRLVTAGPNTAHPKATSKMAQGDLVLGRPFKEVPASAGAHRVVHVVVYRTRTATYGATLAICRVAATPAGSGICRSIAKTSG